jgi:hypothetical protein
MTLTIFSPNTSPRLPPNTGEVLREHAHRPPVDGAVPGDHAVAVRPGRVDAERRRPVPRELVELDERVLVQQQVDPLAGGLLAARVLLVDRARRAGVDRLVSFVLEVGDAPAVVWMSGSAMRG